MIKVYDHVLSEDLLNFIQEEIYQAHWQVHGSLGGKQNFLIVLLQIGLVIIIY